MGGVISGVQLCMAVLCMAVLCMSVCMENVSWRANLLPRAHTSFGQRQVTELWNNPFPNYKILGLPVSRRMRALA